MMKKLFLSPYFFSIYFCLFVLLSLVSQTLAEVKWVNIEGMASMENVTKQEARRLAIEDGMRRAIEEVTGVHMIAETLIINHKLLGDIIKTLPYGKVIEKNILKEDVEKLFKADLTTPSLVYKVKMEVKVA